ncbi:PH (Pleckstrin Homology) domain-containing protein [Kutzneria buriramensis]|uniref:PH (Pleckstrin Homology) domain-containing protein n=1 Tax=Kutzneria buriramensis TaxID=1045776 RepID=A0A3E0HGC6_9PSEU|nr:PH domain-containing protein [Kutzneria buriramensis]REH44779.1 PH (Pleckstrin Homology) domain-containing protein [Kutzneria buriramensis]
MSDTVTFRPKRVRLVAVPVAIGLITVFVVIAILLRNTPTGAYFELSDQVAMAMVGVLLAGGVLLLTRPRVRAQREWIEVRNLLGSTRYRWSDVRGLSFPDGAAWARLELPADEYVSVMAVQSADGARAVTAMRALRALYKDAAAYRDATTQPKS